MGEGEEEGEGAIVGVGLRVAVLQAAGQEVVGESPQALRLMGLGMDLELLYQTGNGTQHIRMEWEVIITHTHTHHRNRPA